MKIVLLYLGRKGAGPEYALEMAKALSRKAEVMCIISTYVSNKHNWLSWAENSTSIKIKEIKTYNSTTEFILKSFNIFIYLDAIRAINRFTPNMIYSPMSHPWERFIIPYCKCKLTVQTIHDAVLHEGENSFRNKLGRFMLSYKSTKNIILSNSFKNYLINKGIKESDILVIPHAVFKGYYFSENIIEDYTFYNRFLFFGRIIKYKGLEVLLEAMKEIAQRVSGVKLVLAGNGDITPYQTMVQECADNLDLHIGWIEDNQVESFFKEIDFVVLPYTHASQSGVIPLAYAFGKPVVATCIGGIPEQVEEGKTGILIQPGNIEELENAICGLLTDSIRLERLKKNCYEYAAMNTWDSSAKVLIDCIDL